MIQATKAFSRTMGPVKLHHIVNYYVPFRFQWLNHAILPLTQGFTRYVRVFTVFLPVKSPLFLLEIGPVLPWVSTKGVFKFTVMGLMSNV